MDNGKLAINVTGPQDKPIRIGGDFQVLNDETKGWLVTESLTDFIAFVLERKAPAAYVFYDQSRCTATHSLDPDRNAKPIAICHIKHSPILDILLSYEGKKVNLQGFEDFIRSVRPYMRGQTALKLIDFIDNVQLVKVKTIRRQKDNQGNFSYAYSSEKGAGDFEFPKELVFKIPIIKNIPAEIEVPFDLYFSWEEAQGEPRLLFSLKNINLNNIIETTIQATIAEVLTKGGLWSRYGTFEIEQMTDEWKYSENQLTVKGL